jgi:nuclear control of ATPase protein 2
MNANIGWVFDRLMAASVEGDRMRLTFAKAAYKAEVARVGSLQKVLSERPADMNDKALLESLSRSNKANATNVEEPIHHKREHVKKSWKTRALEKVMPKVSKYSLRYNAEGKGRLSFRVYDGETVIRSDVSWEILLRSDDFDPRQWMEEARDWTEEARRGLCRILKESVEASIFDDKEARQNLDVIEKWCTYDCGTSDDLVKQWRAILDLAYSLDQRRVSEGREINIADSGLRIWTDRIDLFGIPSSLVAVGLAKLAHVYLAPYWPKFKLAAKRILNIAWRIFKNRFWEPFYGIVQGLINKDSGVLAAFDVQNEEKSLDNMLEDLGLGDGTEATRKEALQSAARLYEDQLANGVIRSAVRGRLVRLLLIQVQQLKAGLLHAMSSIDVLLAANRLNIQLLAAIPAVLIVYVGTRLIYRSLFTIRSKDLRSIRGVHAEMAEYLDEMEMAFLLVPAAPTTIERDVNGTITLAAVLPAVDLGEFVLRVYLYLILLNYASPLFTHRATNAIHKAIEELVSSHRLGVDRQVSLLRLIKQKHMDLLKYL